jgi:hypothetical protein
VFIEGTIYPGGTLPSGFANNDPKAPGGIGKIRCRALVLVPLTDVTTPAASFVTEFYSLPDDSRNIIADGPGANLFATVYRAVLGGTRSFDGVWSAHREESWFEQERSLQSTHNLPTQKVRGCET